jgi:hypothetical protein
MLSYVTKECRANQPEPYILPGCGLLTMAARVPNGVPQTHIAEPFRLGEIKREVQSQIAWPEWWAIY